MQFAKVILTISFIAVLTVVGFVFSSGDETNNRTNSDAFAQIGEGKYRRGDDPLYSEEIRKNAALTIRTQDQQEKLNDKFDETVQAIKQESRRKDRETLNKINGLVADIQNIKLSTDASQVTEQVKQEVSAELQRINENIQQVSNLLKKNDSQLNTKIKQLEQQMAQAANSQVNSSVEPVKRSSDDINEINSIEPASDITYPYGVEGKIKVDGAESTLNAVSSFLNESMNKAGDNANSLLGANYQKNRLPVPGSSRKTEWETVFPVYTLPQNTILSDSTLITPIIGRVPITGGSLEDPFFFKVEVGSENLAANGHTIPGISKMIASGYATGIREQSCARGYIDSLTFIFVDGRIVTHGQASTEGDSNGQAVGYLADKWGKPCIRGKYISNAGQYITSRASAAFLEAAAEGLSQSQVKYTQNKDGNYQAMLDGNVWRFIFGQGVGGSAKEIAEYVRERTANAFDVIYVNQGSPVQIFINEQVPIDYDSNGRKISYYEETEYNDELD